MLQPPFDIGPRIGKISTITAETEHPRGIALDLEDAVFTVSSAYLRVVVGFDLGNAQGKPGRHFRARRHRLDHRDHVVARLDTRRFKSGYACIESDMPGREGVEWP